MAHLVFMRLGRRCLLVRFLRVRCRDSQRACSAQMHSCCACLQRSNMLQHFALHQCNLALLSLHLAAWSLAPPAERSSGDYAV